MSDWRTRWTNDHSLLERIMHWPNPIFEGRQMSATAVYAKTADDGQEAVKQLGLQGNATIFSSAITHRGRGRSFDTFILVGDVIMSEQALRELGPMLLRAKIFRMLEDGSLKQETL